MLRAACCVGAEEAVEDPGGVCQFDSGATVGHLDMARCDVQLDGAAFAVELQSVVQQIRDGPFQCFGAPQHDDVVVGVDDGDGASAAMLVHRGYFPGKSGQVRRFG